MRSAVLRLCAFIPLIVALAVGCVSMPPVPQTISIRSQDGRLPLPGYWFPGAVTEPRPAVISLHGCGGLLDDRGRLSPNRLRVAHYFNLEKMHVLLVDSFTPRGEKSICETPLSQRRIRHEDRRADVFAAIQWLSRQASVDTSRIVVLGYSNGGGTVLSVLDRTDRAVLAQRIQPRAGIAFYPPCAPYVESSTYRLSAPLLLMIGELDDWTSPRQCVRLHAKLKRVQPDASFELIVYPGSHHGFDGYGPLRIRANLPTARGTATVGGNPEARARALRRMFEFVSEQLGTPLLLSHEERLR